MAKTQWPSKSGAECSPVYPIRFAAPLQLPMPLPFPLELADAAGRMGLDGYGETGDAGLRPGVYVLQVSEPHNTCLGDALVPTKSSLFIALGFSLIVMGLTVLQGCSALFGGCR